jgi:hypothetical protein
MNKLDQLPWPLIIGMGALALIRPLLNVTGLMEGLGRPFGPLFVTLLISRAWLAIVILARLRQPLLTLVCTGVVYGIFAILLSVILSSLLTGTLAGPITNPVALVAVLITNGLWGAIVGLLGLGILQMKDSGANR